MTTPTPSPPLRKPLRLPLLALLLLLALGATAMAWWWLWIPAQPSGALGMEETALAKPVAPNVLAQGAYLARLGNCAQCHTTSGGAAYAGGSGIATPFGTVYGGNLTPDPQTGLGLWTADDFWRALHHGQSRDGRVLIPAFPYTSFTHLAREDSDALYAYLQSLPAVHQAPPTQGLSWPYGSRWALKVWQAVNFTPAPALANAPAMSMSVERGRYLVQGLGHCNECHGGRNLWGAPAEKHNLTGAVMPGLPWYAPPLQGTIAGKLPALEGWTAEDMAQFLTHGRNELAVASGPMAEVVHHSSQYLREPDAQAMAQYLISLQTPATAANRPNPGSTATPINTQTVGSRVYEAQCAQCHGKQGEGKANAFPALAGNRAVTMDNTNNLILMVLYGGFGPSTAGVPQPHGMPPFVLALNNADIAAVLSHLRSAWGNRAAPVTEFDVNTIRNLHSPG
ncbi:c-type cytochrome [Rhodoferax sp.]|uniref:c-type cytochrome n=1 Tax=Rhodoferax sp. TaxID=50421 RepID=UPI002ACE729E|nr:c-type cytochrome [Rhodoferax sp.]MDZ7919348.1 c-type cytochrome [Rhodoferax sp.]